MIEDADLESDSRADIRRRQLLSVASELFAMKGFEATSMRDIAAAAGMMSGSIYYHFDSKESLYIAVEDASISKIYNAVKAAIEGTEPGWPQLEAAAIAHAEAMLDRTGFRVLVAPLLPPGLDADVRRELVHQRDRFEQMMAAVIQGLPLPPGTNRRMFQHHYLGAINWIPVWYRPDGESTPTEVARALLGMLRK